MKFSLGWGDREVACHIAFVWENLGARRRWRGTSFMDSPTSVKWMEQMCMRESIVKCTSFCTLQYTTVGCSIFYFRQVGSLNKRRNCWRDIFKLTWSWFCLIFLFFNLSHNQYYLVFPFWCLAILLEKELLFQLNGEFLF